MESLYKSSLEQFLAIELCLKNTLLSSALILIYSGIDSMANLDKSDRFGTRKDFYNWVDKYMQPRAKLNCSAVDLYNARCGILHNNSPDSNLSNIKKAKLIYYVWKIEKEWLQDFVNKNEKEEVVVVQVSELFTVYKQGIERFFSEIEESIDLKEKILNNSGRVFTNISTDY